MIESINYNSSHSNHQTGIIPAAPPEVRKWMDAVDYNTSKSNTGNITMAMPPEVQNWLQQVVNDTKNISDGAAKGQATE